MDSISEALDFVRRISAEQYFLAFVAVPVGWLGGFVWRRVKGLRLARAAVRRSPHICGKWYSFHWSRKHRAPHLQIYRWSVQYQWLRGFTVEVFSLGKDHEPEYKSTGLSREHGTLSVRFRGIPREETWEVRLNYPVERDGARLEGLLLANDYDRVRYAAVVVLVPDAQPDDEFAKKLIQDAARYSAAESALRTSLAEGVSSSSS
jgi:hypothetical protein